MKIIYKDKIKQTVFENACDCIKYGYGFSQLNKCGLSEKESKEIWKAAYNYMAEDF